MKWMTARCARARFPLGWTHWLAVGAGSLLVVGIVLAEDAAPAAADKPAEADKAATTTPAPAAAETPATPATPAATNPPAATAATDAPAATPAAAETPAAAVPPPPPPPIPAVAPVAPGAKHEKGFASENPDRVRTALEEAVVSLRQLARDDPAGFYARPWRQQKLIDWKEYELHYAEKEIDYPVYETYKTKAMVGSGDSSIANDQKLQEVTRIRVAGYKKIKTLVQDPNGPEVRKVKLPVYGQGGPDHLYSGFFGANAMAIYAQLLCGVPAEEEQFARSWGRLLDCVEGYGMPDRTWDLAWLTVAAVNLPQDTALRKKTVQRLINKLLLGQIPDGPAKGMWAPVCLNTALLGKMLAYEQDWMKREMVTWEDRLKKKPDDEHLKEKLNEAKAKIRKFQVQYVDVTTIGMKFDGNTLVKPDQAFLMKVGWSFPDATFGYAPYNLYNERLADLDSTAIALFALQEVARARLLPDQTTMPKTLEGQLIMPPEKTANIIMRALDVLVRLQNAKGRAFSEALSWTPLADFDFMGLPELSLGQPDVPDKEKAFPETENPITRLSAARTYAALARASTLAGALGPNSPVAPVLAKARKTVTSLAEATLRAETNNLPPIGGMFPMSELAFECQPLLTEPGDPLESNRELWLRFADALLATQLANGSWPRLAANTKFYSYIDGYKEEYYEPSVFAYIDARMRQHYEVEQAKLPKDKRKPYDPNANLWRGLPFHYYHYSVQLPAEVVNTAYAMIVLAQGVRPPVLGYWAWDDKPIRTPLVRAVVNKLSKDKRVGFTYRQVLPDLPIDSLRDVPLLYVAGTGAFAPVSPEVLPRLKYFLQNRGAVIVETTASPDGKTFVDQLQQALLPMVDGAQAGPLPELVKGVTLPGLIGPNNRIVAAFCPVTGETTPPSGTVRLPEAATVTYQLIAQTAEPDLLSPAYAIRWPFIEQLELKQAEERAKKEAEEAAKKAAAEAGGAAPAK